jgi:hypothetical protein
MSAPGYSISSKVEEGLARTCVDKRIDTATTKVDFVKMFFIMIPFIKNYK